MSDSREGDPFNVIKGWSKGDGADAPVLSSSRLSVKGNPPKDALDNASRCSIFAHSDYPSWSGAQRARESRDATGTAALPRFDLSQIRPSFPLRKIGHEFFDDEDYDDDGATPTASGSQLNLRDPRAARGSLMGPPPSSDLVRVSRESEFDARIKRRQMALERRRKASPPKFSEKVEGYVGEDKSVDEVLAFIEGEDDPGKGGKGKNKKQKKVDGGGGSSKPKKAGKKKKDGLAEKTAVEEVDAADADLGAASAVAPTFDASVESSGSGCVDVEAAGMDEKRRGVIEEEIESTGDIIRSQDGRSAVSVDPEPNSLPTPKTASDGRPEVAVVAGARADVPGLFDGSAAIPEGTAVVSEEKSDVQGTPRSLSTDGGFEIGKGSSVGEVTDRPIDAVKESIPRKSSERDDAVETCVASSASEKPQPRVDQVTPAVAVGAPSDTYTTAVDSGAGSDVAGLATPSPGAAGNDPSFKDDFYSVAPLADSNEAAAVSGLVAGGDDGAFRKVTNKKRQPRPALLPTSTPAPAPARFPHAGGTRPPHPGSIVPYQPFGTRVMGGVGPVQDRGQGYPQHALSWELDALYGDYFDTGPCEPRRRDDGPGRYGAGCPQPQHQRQFGRTPAPRPRFSSDKKGFRGRPRGHDRPPAPPPPPPQQERPRMMGRGAPRFVAKAPKFDSLRPAWSSNQQQHHRQQQQPFVEQTKKFKEDVKLDGGIVANEEEFPPLVPTAARKSVSEGEAAKQAERERAKSQVVGKAGNPPETVADETVEHKVEAEAVERKPGKEESETTGELCSFSTDEGFGNEEDVSVEEVAVCDAGTVLDEHIPENPSVHDFSVQTGVSFLASDQTDDDDEEESPPPRRVSSSVASSTQTSEVELLIYQVVIASDFLGRVVSPSPRSAFHSAGNSDGAEASVSPSPRSAFHSAGNSDGAEASVPSSNGKRGRELPVNSEAGDDCSYNYEAVKNYMWDKWRDVERRVVDGRARYLGGGS